MKAHLLSALVAASAVILTSCSELNDTTASAVELKTNAFHPATPNQEKAENGMTGTKDKHGFPTYNVATRNRYVRTTAYSDAENEPGAEGNLNAAGSVLKYGKVRSAAADWSIYPLGTTFKIKGLPHTYFVDDYGSALVGTNTIDIYHPSLKLMRKWGTRPVEITIIRMGDWERSAALLKGRRGHRHCAKMYYGVMKNMKAASASDSKVALRD